MENDVDRSTERRFPQALNFTIELVDLNTVFNAGAQLIVVAAKLLVLYLKLRDAVLA